jgi:hypothetical protein
MKYNKPIICENHPKNSFPVNAVIVGLGIFVQEYDKLSYIKNDMDRIREAKFYATSLVLMECQCKTCLDLSIAINNLNFNL